MILHVDMDAYYAAIEQREDPSLREKPVIVGGPTSTRGVVCAASYEAREFGVHSAMPMATAVRRCPHGVFLPARMSFYAEVAKQIREIFYRYTPLVEPLALDEAFLDVTGSQRIFGSAIEIGERVRNDIRDELELVASVGVAPNKFVAKIASDIEKPDGFVVVKPEEVQDFLDPLPVRRLWGVGKVAGKAFDRIGVRTIAQLRSRPADLVESAFGEFGLHLMRLANGEDSRAVVPDREAKTISHETTLAVDVSDHEVVLTQIMELSDQVGRRLRRHGLFGRTVQLKVRFSDFQTVTRSTSLTNPTDLTQEIYDAARHLCETRIPKGRGIRLLGVGLSGLSSNALRQKLLFDEVEHQQNQQADQATDAIREKFGRHAVRRASGLTHDPKRKRDAR